MSGPGSTTIVDDAAAAIVAQTEVMSLLVTNVGLCAEALVDLNQTLLALKNAQTLNASILKDIGNSVKHQTQTIEQQAVVQNMAAVDQIKANAINQAEQKAALARAGLDPAPLPELKETVKTAITGDTVLRGLTEFENNVSDFTTNQLQKLLAYIKSTSIYTAGADAIDSLVAAVKSVLVIPDFLKPQDAKAVASGEVIDATVIRA